jgi:hypothetical protein
MLQIADVTQLFPAYPLVQIQEIPAFGAEVIVFRFSQTDWRGAVALVRGVAPTFSFPDGGAVGEVFFTSVSIAQPSDIGAPVVNRDGLVVGLVYGGVTGVYSLAITASTMREFLAAHG